MTKTNFATALTALTIMQPVSMLFAHDGKHDIQNVQLPDQLFHWLVTDYGWLLPFALLLGILMNKIICLSISEKTG